MYKTLAKYYIPGLLVTGLFFGMCNSPEDQESKLGKAGDQFDLFAVLSLFEKSSSPEEFEKSVNTQSNGVNNLDLNEDGETDYVKVIDKKINESSHCFILQVDIAEGSTQDIATIEMQKIKDGEAHVQIIGDPELYGSDYIVEPKSKVAAAGFVVATTYAVNVWSWPFVTYVYSPAYVVYESPYRYEYYPVWYEPWPVVAYEVYYPVVSVYRVNYVYSDGYRFVNIHEHYHSNYHVSTKFNYHEKDHGNGKPVNVPNHNNGNSGASPGQGNNESGGGNQKENNGYDAGGKDNGTDNSNHKSGKSDNDKSQPGNDGKSEPKKDPNAGEGNSGAGSKQDKSPPKEVKSPAKSPSAPKQNAQPKQPSAPKGGKQSGGGGGGKHH